MGLFKRGPLVAVILGMAAACTVHQSNEAPPLSGPSTLSQSLTVTATPDRLTQDGQSQAAIAVRVFDANGQPASAVPVRVDILVNGTLVDYGTLSAKNIVTGSDGRATTVYTAPPPPPATAPASSTVTIRAVPVGGNAQASVPFSADIRLVPPGVILPPAETPTAAFTISPTVPAANIPIQFDGTSSCGGPLVNGACQSTSQITSYAWSFGDGASATGRTTSHTYPATNSFNATLTVTNDRGISASVTHLIAIGAASLPNAVFTFSPAAPGIGETVFFTAVASTAGEDHTIASYQWLFGDGATARGATATHQYATAGTYTVTATVADEAGQTGSATQTVTVGNPPAPTARFTFSPTQPAVNDVVVFSAATSTTAQGQTITDYFWNFGDDPSCPAVSGVTTCYVQTSSSVITHQYARNGTFSVNVVVRDSAGRTGSTSNTVPVGAGLPVAAINVSPSSGVTTTTVVTFDGSGSAAFGGATIVTYTWNFDDPAGSADIITSTPRITHTFAPPARSHLVRLTVTDSQNRTGTTTITVVVGP